MNDDTVQGQQDVPDSEQAEAMPTSDQNQADESSQDDGSLPDDASDRTRKQFEKLRDENRRLKAEQSAKQYGNSVFDSFHPQDVAQQVPQQNVSNLSNQQVESITTQFVDAQGNVDINGLNRALATANARAYQAELLSAQAQQRVTRIEELQQVREAHAVHPALDPEADNFDPRFFELVRDRLLSNMYQGKAQSLLQAANEIRKSYQSPPVVNVGQVKEEAVAEYKNSQQAKRRQAPLSTGKGQPRQESASDMEELIRRTRLGDWDAAAERMRRIEAADKANRSK